MKDQNILNWRFKTSLIWSGNLGEFEITFAKHVAIIHVTKVFVLMDTDTYIIKKSCSKVYFRKAALKKIVKSLDM